MIILFYYSVKSVNMRDEWRNRLFNICKALRKGRLRKVTKETFKCYYYACINFMLNFPKPIYFSISDGAVKGIWMNKNMTLFWDTLTIINYSLSLSYHRFSFLFYKSKHKRKVFELHIIATPTGCCDYESV